jgi:hypothetical protein
MPQPAYQEYNVGSQQPAQMMNPNGFYPPNHFPIKTPEMVGKFMPMTLSYI